MPCEDCLSNCALMCGHSPVYWDEWTDCGTEYNVSCDGFEYGHRNRDCDICTRCGKLTYATDL